MYVVLVNSKTNYDIKGFSVGYELTQPYKPVVSHRNVREVLSISR